MVEGTIVLMRVEFRLTRAVIQNQKKRELFRSIAVEAMTRFEVQGLHKNLEISSENLKKSIIERNSVMALVSIIPPFCMMLVNHIYS